MPQEVATAEDDHSELSPFRSRWQENHGNLLMSFVGVILVIGSGVLLYTQNRFVPPRFPESDMIVKPATDTIMVGPNLAPDEAIVIRVTGAANDFGSIKIAIYDNKQTFNDPDRAIATNSLKLENGEASWTVPAAELPKKIAIAVYHDENEDDSLTLNRFGIPSERYGFSRNARGLVGPPEFDEASITTPKGGTTLDLFIR